MAASKKHDDDQPKAAPTPSRQLAPAASSDDPAVQFRLAELEAARANDDEAGAKAAIDALAEMGFRP